MNEQVRHLFSNTREFLSGGEADIGERALLSNHAQMYGHLNSLDCSDFETEDLDEDIFDHLNDVNAIIVGETEENVGNAGEVLRRAYSDAEEVYSKRVSLDSLNMGYIAVVSTPEGAYRGINVVPQDESYQIRSCSFRMD